MGKAYSMLCFLVFGLLPIPLMVALYSKVVYSLWFKRNDDPSQKQMVPTRYILRRAQENLQPRGELLYDRIGHARRKIWIKPLKRRPILKWFEPCFTPSRYHIKRNRLSCQPLLRAKAGPSRPGLEIGWNRAKNEKWVRFCIIMISSSVPSWKVLSGLKIGAFRHKHPKWDQSPWFILLSETRSIPTICESPLESAVPLP